MVTIPSSVVHNETDAVAIAAASSLTQTAWSFAEFNTRADVDYDVSLLPPQAAQSVFLERTVTYTLSLINTGLLTNTYKLSGTLSSWPFTIDPLSVTLPAQISATIQVSVTAPLTITYPVSDVLRVTASGTSAEAYSDLVTMMTLRQIFLPIFLQ